MSEQVWMLKTSSLPRSEIVARYENWGTPEEAIRVGDAYRAGKTLSPDEYPKWLGEDDPDTEHHENMIEAGLKPPKRKLFPLAVLFGGSFLFANAEAGEVLSKFEMGTNTLHQLDLYARDLKIKYDQTTASWIDVAEMHSLMDVEKSKGLMDASPPDKPDSRWMARSRTDLIIRSPLPPVDMWRDPQLTYAVFVKDGLVQALMKLKGGKKLQFQLCRM